MEETKQVRCSIMRGGTSKAVFFLENDVPSNPDMRKKFILAVFGSPDKRQIDGLGGADPLTSKCAIIGPSTKEGADINYSFYQVGIDTEVVKPSICGNISAAVGPFAIDNGLVRATDPVTKIRIYNPYTDRILIAEVLSQNGRAIVEGDYHIAGVPGTGAKIALDWKNVIGGETGALLPTGNVKDKITVPGLGEINVSIVESGNPVVFVKASDIGLKGIELPAEIDENKNLLETLELIRGIAGELAGLIQDKTKSREQNPNHPHLAFVGQPATYTTVSGRKIDAEEVDLVARTMFMQVMHKTYPGTGLICIGTAAKIGGTVVNDLLPTEKRVKGTLTVGHPGGITEVESEVMKVGNQFTVKRAAYNRTARKIMEGHVYVRRSLLA